MYCSKCGNNVPDTSSTCPHCGAAVEPVSGRPQSGQPAYVPGGYTAPPQSPPPAPPQQGYAPPPQQPYAAQQRPAPAYTPAPAPATAPAAQPLGVGGWVGTIIVLGIPVVGLILALVWAFGSGGDIGRRNYCRATLLLALIGTVLLIVVGILGGASILALIDSLKYLV